MDNTETRVVENSKSATLNDEMKQKKREYYRRWRAAHPENVKRNNERFWRRKIMREMEQNTGE